MSASRPVLLGMIAVVGALGLGWWLLGSKTSSVPVVIYVVDTLRADRLGLYGYPRKTSPELDALAAESVVFEQAYAPAPWTLPSVASILTSTFPCEHGVLKEKQKLNPGLQTLAERVRSAGYATAAYYSNWYVGNIADLDRGYETSVMEWPDQRRADEVMAFTQKVGTRPFLLYLHTMEPHDLSWAPTEALKPFGHVSVDTRVAYRKAADQYRQALAADWRDNRPLGTTDATEEITDALAKLKALRPAASDLYDAAVRAADHNLGEVIATLKADGVWERGIFVFLSDHGEELGEHDGWLHDQSVYEELVRVPLLIHFPDGKYGGTRLASVVSLVDLMPTILDYIGLEKLCAGCRGQSLLPVLGSELSDDETKTLVPTMRHNERHFYRTWKQGRGDVNVVLRRGSLKAIWNAEPDAVELYELEADAGETSNLQPQRQAEARQLRDEAAAWLATCRSQLQPPVTVDSIDPRAIEQLRAVGYIN